MVGNILNPSPAIYTGSFSGYIGRDYAEPVGTGLQLTAGRLLLIEAFSASAVLLLALGWPFWQIASWSSLSDLIIITLLEPLWLSLSPDLSGRTTSPVKLYLSFQRSPAATIPA